jgi:hypothetical protein
LRLRPTRPNPSQPVEKLKNDPNFALSAKIGSFFRIFDQAAV